MATKRATGPLRVAFGSDHKGVGLRGELTRLSAACGHVVCDVGATGSTRVLYADYARLVTALVAGGEADAGVLICGSGVGMSIAANRHPLIRAALIHDVGTARLSRAHNAANVLCLGANVVTGPVAADLLRVFLGTPFEGGRHAAQLLRVADVRGATEVTP
jgi:ribose 5-phosphate isomerase B